VSPDNALLPVGLHGDACPEVDFHYPSVLAAEVHVWKEPRPDQNAPRLPLWVMFESTYIDAPGFLRYGIPSSHPPFSDMLVSSWVTAEKLVIDHHATGVTYIVISDTSGHVHRKEMSTLSSDQAEHDDKHCHSDVEVFSLSFAWQAKSHLRQGPDIRKLSPWSFYV
jgi:hypothetical protein